MLATLVVTRRAHGASGVWESWNLALAVLAALVIAIQISLRIRRLGVRIPPSALGELLQG